MRLGSLSGTIGLSCELVASVLLLMSLHFFKSSFLSFPLLHEAFSCVLVLYPKHYSFTKNKIVHILTEVACFCPCVKGCHVSITGFIFFLISGVKVLSFKCLVQFANGILVKLLYNLD